jgi:hypothetical protein
LAGRDKGQGAPVELAREARHPSDSSPASEPYCTLGSSLHHPSDGSQDPCRRPVVPADVGSSLHCPTDGSQEPCCRPVVPAVVGSSPHYPSDGSREPIVPDVILTVARLGELSAAEVAEWDAAIKEQRVISQVTSQ